MVCDKLIDSGPICPHVFSLFNLGAVELPSLTEYFAQLLRVPVGRVFEHKSSVLGGTEKQQDLFRDRRSKICGTIKSIAGVRKNTKSFAHDAHTKRLRQTKKNLSPRAPSKDNSIRSTCAYP